MKDLLIVSPIIFLSLLSVYYLIKQKRNPKNTCACCSGCSKDCKAKE